MIKFQVFCLPTGKCKSPQNWLQNSTIEARSNYQQKNFLVSTLVLGVLLYFIDPRIRKVKNTASGWCLFAKITSNAYRPLPQFFFIYIKKENYYLNLETASPSPLLCPTAQHIMAISEGSF